MINMLKKSWAMLLALFFVSLYLLPLNGRLLRQPDETRYAEISREMLQRGDWVVPHLLGLRYFEKPVAGYWVNNISQWLFGHNNFAVRFGSVFSTALSAGLIFWLAMLLWRSRSTAFLATLIYLSSLLVFSVGTYSVLDPMISLWMTAAMVSFYLTLHAKTLLHKIAAYALLGLACGMGFMTKGFLALAVPVIAVLPIVVQQRKVKELITFGPVAVLFALLLSLPWALAIAYREPDFWHYFFWIEHIQRFVADNAQHKAPFWYYFPILCAGVLPWLGLLPGSLIKGWRERVSRPELFFLLSWVIMPLLFFSVAKGKLLTYILPCMAPLSMLMAAYAKDCVSSLHLGAFKVNGMINLAFGGVAICIVLILGRGIFPEIVIFAPHERFKIAFAVASFAAWGLIGGLSLKNEARGWQWAAACPLLLSFLVGYAIPQQVIDSKQPQNFITSNISALNQSRYVLTNSVGVAAGLAWQLKRSDVLMFNQQGELQYGLAYPDAKAQFVHNTDFPAWLAQARQQGDVSLVLHLPEGGEVENSLPEADHINRTHRLVLLLYKALP